MELLQGETFTRQFHSISRRAFHLEVQDSYHTPDESGPFDLFLNGRADDLRWHQPWLDLVRGLTAVGRSVDRVRLISEPHVDYTRWGLSIAPHNIDAGEDIRWLPRHLVDMSEVPPDHFWLLDEDRVMFTVFEPNGRFVGGAMTSDPSIVTYCRAARDRLWSQAVPHWEYVSPVQHA